jgi:hypothetical protein
MQSSARAPTNQPQLAAELTDFIPLFSFPDSHELEMNGQQRVFWYKYSTIFESIL